MGEKLLINKSEIEMKFRKNLEELMCNRISELTGVKYIPFSLDIGWRLVFHMRVGKGKISVKQVEELAKIISEKIRKLLKKIRKDRYIYWSVWRHPLQDGWMFAVGTSKVDRRLP